MPDIICPECKRRIRSYEVECPHCGFQLQKYMQDNRIEDLKKKILCTRCGKNGDSLAGVVEVKCSFCNIPMVQLDYSSQEFTDKYNDTLEGIPEQIMENLGIGMLELERMIQKKDPRILEEITKIKGDNPYALFLKEQFPDTFDINVFKERIEQEKQKAEAMKPRCPRCGSTNVKVCQEVAGELFGHYYRCSNCFNSFYTPK